MEDFLSSSWKFFFSQFIDQPEEEKQDYLYYYVGITCLLVLLFGYMIFFRKRKRKYSSGLTKSSSLTSTSNSSRASHLQSPFVSSNSNKTQQSFNLQNQKSLKKKAFNLISAALDMEKKSSISLNHLIQQYKEGEKILLEALNIQFLPSEL